MTLTNYWLLLLWLAAAGAVCRIYFIKKPVTVLGKTEYRWGWVPVLIMVLPYVFWAANRHNFGDTETYRKSFSALPTSLSEFQSYFSTVTKDRGFTILSFLIKCLIGNQDTAFFFIIAAFQMYCVAHFFRKYSGSFLLCLFMFVASTDYLSWMFNGIRQFLAVCIILLSFGLILRKKYIPAILIICLASTIHGSALLMLPVMFIAQGKAFNIWTVLMTIAIAFAIMFVERFTSILSELLMDTQYDDLLINGIWENDDGTNIFRVAFYSIPAALALVGWKKIRQENDPVVNLCVNFSLVTSLFYILSAATSGIYIGRIPIYTTLPGYAVCPWIIDRLFTKRSVPIVYVVLILAFLTFFYYQMHVAWQIL